VSTLNQFSSNYKFLTNEEKLCPDLYQCRISNGVVFYHLPLIEFFDEYSVDHYRNDPYGSGMKFESEIPEIIEKCHQKTRQRRCYAELSNKEGSFFCKYKRDGFSRQQEFLDHFNEVDSQLICGSFIKFFVVIYNGRKILVGMFEPREDFLNTLRYMHDEKVCYGQLLAKLRSLKSTTHRPLWVERAREPVCEYLQIVGIDIEIKDYSQDN